MPDLRVRRTKKLLYDSLLTLIKTENKRFAEVSVKQICERAMVHRSTFYHYYTDKYDLFFAEISLTDAITIDQRKKRLLQPFQMFAQQQNYDLLWQIALNNQDDSHFNQLVGTVVEQILGADLQFLIDVEVFPVPLEIVFPVYAHTIGSILVYWLKNGKQEQPQVLDAYLTKLLHPIFFESLRS
ncbi:TetR/AcrR family transcriptional regulator [Brochothrix campestris]|uniref:TetR family transcriptional regulator n=1 Tax=Brochothrix campestris FSL F6-1037 TaxID=1265861 RepID=W7CMU7_9LIST|nr:TetR/AcrR family transcriptional regulator [Brochothrix campestris]EUJ38387.1 TetR family transcriptional regulator [Brochothrix campestris FSL F6-1037]